MWELDPSRSIETSEEPCTPWLTSADYTLSMSVNLGPVTPNLAEPEVVPQAGNGLNYNPRCLKRDISEWVSSRFNKDSDSASLILNSSDTATFQTTMQGIFDQGLYGVHTGGHFTYQGDPAGDLFSSPGDPMFYLHHAQIDRTWWIWQMQDPDNRLDAIAGTVTLNNNPPSRNGSLEDLLDLDVNAAPMKIADVISTAGSIFCYTYL